MKMKSITVKNLGEMIGDEKNPDLWLSKPVGVNLFDGLELVFCFLNRTGKSDENKEGFEIAAYNFLSLDSSVKDSVSKLVYENYKKMLDNSDIVPLDIVKEADAWKYVHPRNVIVSRRNNNDKDVYVQVICFCDWETEHDLQLVFREGRKLTRVSAADGHLTDADAYGIPDEQDKLLSSY